MSTELKKSQVMVIILTFLKLKELLLLNLVNIKFYIKWVPLAMTREKLFPWVPTAETLFKNAGFTPKEYKSLFATKQLRRLDKAENKVAKAFGTYLHLLK